LIAASISMRLLDVFASPPLISAFFSPKIRMADQPPLPHPVPFLWLHAPSV
jgi:hypothetical protein